MFCFVWKYIKFTSITKMLQIIYKYVLENVGMFSKLYFSYQLQQIIFKALILFNCGENFFVLRPRLLSDRLPWDAFSKSVYTWLGVNIFSVSFLMSSFFDAIRVFFRNRKGYYSMPVFNFVDWTHLPRREC